MTAVLAGTCGAIIRFFTGFGTHEDASASVFIFPANRDVGSRARMVVSGGSSIKLADKVVMALAHCELMGVADFFREDRFAGYELGDDGFVPIGVVDGDF